MKNPRDVLQKKELDLKRVRTEVAALHGVISLLVEASDCAEYGLAVPPNVQEIGKDSEKPLLSRVEELSPGLSTDGAKLRGGNPVACDQARSPAVIRLRQMREGLSRIMRKRMLKRAA